MNRWAKCFFIFFTMLTISHDAKAAISLNGTSQLVGIPDNAMGIANAFTISAWINSMSSGAVQMIVCRDNGTIRCFQFRLTAQNYLELIRNSAVTDLITTGVSISTGTGVWHHVCAVFDSTRGDFLYIDGVLITSDAVTTLNADTTGSLPAIGARSTAGTFLFKGNIEDILIYAFPFSANQINSLAKSRERILITSPGKTYAIYPCDDLPSNSVIGSLLDRSGNGNNGVPTAIPTYTSGILNYP